MIMDHTLLSKPDTTVGFLLATAYSPLSRYAVKVVFSGVLVGLPGDAGRFGIFPSIHWLSKNFPRRANKKTSLPFLLEQPLSAVRHLVTQDPLAAFFN